MPRIRAIKHDYFTNDDLAQVSLAARLLGLGLTTLADREGRLEDRPMRIRAQIFPYDQQLNCDDLLDELQDAQFIHRYAVEDRHYIQVVNFHRHQKPHPTEKPSKIPGDPQAVNMIGGDMGNGLTGNDLLVTGNSQRVMEKQPKPRRAEIFPIPPESMLELNQEDRLWCEQYAPNVPDPKRATLKWFEKQQSNRGRGKDLDAWKASWRGYMMNYSDGEIVRNGNGNEKTNYSGKPGVAPTGSQIDDSIWNRNCHH